MTALRLRDMALPAWRGVGTEYVGVLGALYPAGLFQEEAAKYPDELVRGRILFQTGEVYFSALGEYEEPTGPVVVLWELSLGGVAVKTIQSLIGPTTAEYPSVSIDADSRFIPRPGVRPDTAENGTLRGRALATQDGYDITLYHHQISAAEKTAVMNHFNGFSDLEFDITRPSGEVYRVRYQSVPVATPRAGGRWTMVVRLNGYLLVDAATAEEGDYPALDYDASSQFSARAGIIPDPAEDGLTRTSRNYDDLVWDIMLIYTSLTTAQYLAFQGHYLQYRLENFAFTSHADEDYLVQYVERPFGVMHKTDDWTLTVRLIGVLD